MQKLRYFIASTTLAAALATVPAHASKESDQAAAAALLLLGIAALAHNNDHHANGTHFADAEKTANFERGFSDGLYNARFDTRHSTASYRDGYSAGVKERDNRLAHRRGATGNKAPTKAIKACVNEAAKRWNRKVHEVHATTTRRIRKDSFAVEVAAGHRHGNCSVNAHGKIQSFQKGRI